MEYRYIRYACAEGIATLTIDRPEVRNAMNNDCWRELTSLIQQADQDPGVRVVILTGAGEKAFISGADIRTLQTRTSVESLEGLAIGALQAIEDCSKPVIAAVNGVAFGGGFETALACDLRIVSEKAKFGLPEVNLGILPGAGGTQRLTRTVGVGPAKEIILAGRVISAQEAVTMGLALRTAAPEHLMEAAVETAKTVMTKAPLSLMLAKRMVDAALDLDHLSGIRMENLAFSVLTSTQDKLEGTTAFLEKRPPEYQGK